MHVSSDCGCPNSKLCLRFRGWLAVAVSWNIANSLPVLLQGCWNLFWDIRRHSLSSCLNRASIWPVSIITNSCTHSSIFIKNTLKVHVKFTPTCFGSQMEPSSGGQQLILAKVYKWFNGTRPYSQYCGGIRKPMCVCTARCTEVQYSLLPYN